MEDSSIKDTVKSWLERSEDDLATAKILLDSGRYNWSAFICQQALEKCLKAGYVDKHQELPPYIHKLERLLSLLALEPPSEVVDAIIEIDKYYLAARYPTYKDNVNIDNEMQARNIYRAAEMSYKWLRQTLKL